MTSHFGPTPERTVRTIRNFLRHNPARHRVVAAIALLFVAGASIRGACDPLRVQALVLSAVITSLLVLTDLRRPANVRAPVGPQCPPRRRAPAPTVAGAFPFPQDPPQAGAPNPSLCSACGHVIFPTAADPAPPPLPAGWGAGAGSLDDFLAANDDDALGDVTAPAAREAAVPPSAPPRFEEAIPELQVVFPPNHNAARPARRAYAGSSSKQLLDRLGAACLLVLLAPMLLAITCSLAALGGKPVLVHRARPDWSGRTFRVRQFGIRAATPRAAAREKSAGVKQRQGGPVTARVRAALCLEEYLVRTGLAALPSLISVLRGDMSLVGPQPTSASEARLDRAGRVIVAEFALRAGVRPALLGWSQINGRCRAMARAPERIAADLHYLENSSLWLDLRLLGGAFRALLLGEGAS